MGRQLARRILIWSVLAAVLAGAVWLAVAVPGSSWVLTGWSGFDRERYDAAQVVDAFGERLRSSVSPDATATDLERTLQPSAAGIWTAGESR